MAIGIVGVFLSWWACFWGGIHFGKMLKREEIVRGIQLALEHKQVTITFPEPKEDGIGSLIGEWRH